MVSEEKPTRQKTGEHKADGHENHSFKKLSLLRSVRAKFSSSVLWALLFTAVIAVWAVTGDIKGGSSLKTGAKIAEGTQSRSLANAKKNSEDGAAPFAVRTAVFQVKEYPMKLIIRGRTFSDTQVDIRAETSGAIIKLPVEKGDYVEAGTLLCLLEDGARAATLLEAEAGVAQAKADYEASVKLERRGHTAGLKVLQNKAIYNRAQAALAKAKLDLERTKIKAPFKGYIEKLPAKVGSLLSVGEQCATLVALDPLHVIGAVRESDVQKIKPGMKGVARLITGETVEGTIDFISATAERETRTFRLELIIPNKDGKLKSGVTSDIEISLPERRAMLLPASILVLNDEGKVGVRLVNGENKVMFLPISILSEQKEGIWVEALPTSAVITVGQDFVKEGQIVNPTLDNNYKAKPGS